MECKNCKNSLRNFDGFCSSCGARIIDERISFRFLFNEFLEKVLSVDNKLLKTFLHLFTKPEVVIDGFINGVRKKYYNPISYLLISITLSGIYLYFLKDVAFEAMDIASDPNNPFANEEFMKNIFNFTADYQALFTVVNIPVYGFISWLVFLNKKKYNFYEHLIIYLYTASQTAVLSFLIVVPFYFIDRKLSGLLTVIMSALTIVYFAYVLIRLFKLTFFQFIIKAIYSSIIFIFTILFLGLLMNLSMYLYMGKEEYLKQIQPPNTNDSIQKTDKLDSTKVVQKNDSIKTLILD